MPLKVAPFFHNEQINITGQVLYMEYIIKNKQVSVYPAPSVYGNGINHTTHIFNNAIQLHHYLYQ